MKIGGQTVQGSHRVIIPIVRDVPRYFVLGPVTDTAGFFEQFPSPKPPMIHNVETNMDEPDFGSAKFRAAQLTHNGQFLDWLALSSIKAGAIGHTGQELPVTWDTIDMDDPTTFKNWRQELTDAGHTDAEINRLMDGVMEVNSLSEEAVAKARADFLRGRAEVNLGASPSTEPDSTPSGEPVSASE